MTPLQIATRLTRIVARAEICRAELLDGHYGKFNKELLRLHKEIGKLAADYLAPKKPETKIAVAK